MGERLDEVFMKCFEKPELVEASGQWKMRTSTALPTRCEELDRVAMRPAHNCRSCRAPEKWLWPLLAAAGKRDFVSRTRADRVAAVKRVEDKFHGACVPILHLRSDAMHSKLV